MYVLSLQMLRKPIYALILVALTSLYAILMLFLDEFLFISPYFTVFIPLPRINIFVIDLILAFAIGFVMASSIYQFRLLRSQRNTPRRTGLVGMFTGIVAGACPCYYLFPLLSVAGSIGGFLGVIGIWLFAYQIPIKIAAIGLLAFAAYKSERTLRASCNIEGPLIRLRQ